MIVTFSAEILADGEISADEARRKWNETAGSRARKTKVKGKPLFLHGMKGNKFTLYYYQSYGTDWCDTVFTGDIFEYDDGKSQIFGKVTASPSMKKFAAGLAIGTVPILLTIWIVLYYFGVYMPALVFYGIVIAAAVSAVMSLAVDKGKVRVVMEYLHEFLKEGVKEDEGD